MQGWTGTPRQRSICAAMPWILSNVLPLRHLECWSYFVDYLVSTIRKEQQMGRLLTANLAPNLELVFVKHYESATVCENEEVVRVKSWHHIVNCARRLGIRFFLLRPFWTTANAGAKPTTIATNEFQTSHPYASIKNDHFTQLYIFWASHIVPYASRHDRVKCAYPVRMKSRFRWQYFLRTL